MRVGNRLLNYGVRPFKLAYDTGEFFCNSKSIPNRVDIEVTNISNANCIFCAHQYDKRNKVLIKDEIFYKTVDQCFLYGVSAIGLTSMVGDVFLDKDIFKKLDYIKNKNIDVGSVNTKALNIHEVGVDKILNCGLTRIGISLASMREDIYTSRYRTSGHRYRQLLENIKEILIAFKNSKGKDYSVKNISFEFRADRPTSEIMNMPDYQKYLKLFLTECVTVGGYTEFDSWSGAIEETELLGGMRLVYNTGTRGSHVIDFLTFR